jgi:branched-chain amino acid transport system ATP-binding protein
MLLTIKDLRVHYGAVEAIKGISLDVEEGSVVTLIGSNGAGKTTIMRTISGLVRPTSGELWFKGPRIDEASPSALVKMGIAQVPEGRRVFPYMSVWENLMLGAFTRTDKAGIKEDLELVYTHFPVLKARTKQEAGTLSGGEQQMVAMGRALMVHPSLLLLDEPSLGLAPLMVAEIEEIIRTLNKTTGVTTLLVEQNARVALRLAHSGYVMEVGNVVLAGSSQELSSDEGVKRAYLGA